ATPRRRRRGRAPPAARARRTPGGRASTCRCRGRRRRARPSLGRGHRPARDRARRGRSCDGAPRRPRPPRGAAPPPAPAGLAPATHPALRAAATAAIARYGCGTGASRLIAGHLDLHAEVEAKLAAFKGTPAALLFPSGYQANVGAITALVGRGDHVYSDALNHASIIDGCR